MRTLLLLLSLSPLLSGQNENGNWVPTFGDEFNGAELDLSHWAPHDPRGQQAKSFAPETVVVSGGQLHIAAGGVVSTFGTFSQTYGRFEIRCRVPAGRGLRPRFLLLPVAPGPLPEIEVFETTGSSPSKVFFANRWGTEQTERSFGDSFIGPDLSTGFHTVSIEWDRQKITWFIDGKEKFVSVDGVPRQPMYLLLDLAADRPDESASFDIDYIRVYQSRPVR
jgi:beta-glucanase (GH16 family)